ncbi:MAG: dephospho-CoA kinase [Candidatus Aminicenantes bacterium]|nr:dephospho-CoA kinase [Candidatus Aminicenantes bacterium]
MLLVALTGGIVCGKSVIGRLWLEKGCFVHSADTAARELMSPGTDVWRVVADHFGPGVLSEDGTIDRAHLGAIIFSDDKERAFLNGLVHPLVLERIKEMVARLEKEGRHTIFVSEAALVVEAGFARFYDKIVVAHCGRDIQVRRLMERDGIDRGKALKKIRSQLGQEEKLKHADYVIDTSGTLAETIEQTERVYAQLVLDGELKRTKISGRRRTTGA